MKILKISIANKDNNEEKLSKVFSYLVLWCPNSIVH